MEIKPLSDRFYYIPNGEQKQQKTDAANPMKDKLEISSEAIHKAEEDKNLDIIKERINNKFYDNDAIIDKVAEEILKEIYNS